MQRPGWADRSRFFALGALVLSVAAAVAGCSSVGDEPAATTTVVSAAVPTIRSGPAPNGSVEVGEELYEFVAECFLPGDGNVDIVGEGFDANGPTELLIRRVPGRPYVGLRASGSLLEPSLEADVLFTIDAGVVRAEGIDFVRDLDLDSGEGTPLGTAMITVTCDSYTNGSP